jgi:hypothetical protein
MPLKEPDLKDTDTYKKASRVDLPKVASGNAKFWIYKDVELPNTSGKKQKYPAFLALVDDNGIRKAMTGKKLICKGTCSMKEDRIAFEPTTGTVPYKLLKTSLPLLLGKAVWIPTGMEAAGEEGEGEETAPQAQASGAPPPPPPQPQAAAAPPAKAPAPPLPPPAQAAGAPPLTAASLTGPWTKLVKDVQTYSAAHPERKADLFRDMAAIGALLKANEAAEAKTKMDKMQAILDAPPAAAPPPPPKAAAAPPAQPPGAPPLTAASLTGPWTKLVKDVQAYAAAHPERKADLFRDMAAIGALLKANEAAEAKTKMDKMQATLDAPPAGEGKPEAKKATEAEEEEAGEGEDEEEEKEAAELQKDVKGKMVAALAQVRSRAPREGEEPKPQLRFMAYLAGKSNSVIVAKKVGGGSKKLLAEIAGASGGKIVMGDCIFEKGVHTFVLAKVPGGLAKKLTVALLAETGAKYRVRVRAIDGSVDLDSETDVDPDAAPVSEEAKKLTAGDISAAWQKLLPEIQQKAGLDPAIREAAMRARKQVEELTKAGRFEAAMQAVEELAELLHKTSEEAQTREVESEEEKAPPDPKKAEFERKFEQMDKNVQRALKERIGDASRIRAAVALAQERAETGDYATALRVLVSLETMIEEGEIDRADMPVAGLVEYRAKLAAYDSARQRVERQLDALVAAIPKTVSDEAELGEDLRDEVLEQIQEVQELIDDAVNAANDNKAPVYAALKNQLGKNIQKIEGNKLLEHLEKNTFGVAIDIRQTLTKALQEVLAAIPVEV